MGTGRLFCSWVLLHWDLQNPHQELLHCTKTALPTKPQTHRVPVKKKSSPKSLNTFMSVLFHPPWPSFKASGLPNAVHHREL